MSLLTSLAYAITVAVRPRVRDAEVAALQAQVDDLRREINEVLPRVERQRDDWQALAMRYRDELHAGTPPQRHFIDEEMRLRMQAQMQAAQANQAQAQAQQHQYLMLQNGPMIGQQLGMQGFGQQLDEYVRNCTPGRHELFMRG